MRKIILVCVLVAMTSLGCKKDSQSSGAVIDGNDSSGSINWSTFRPGKKIAKSREYGTGYSNAWSHDFTWIWNGDNLTQIVSQTTSGCRFTYDDQNKISGIDFWEGETTYNGREEFHYDGSRLGQVKFDDEEFNFTYSGNKIKTIADKHSNTYSYTWQNGNVTKIEMKASRENIAIVYEYKYDSKNNPFYGCFYKGFYPIGLFHQDFSKNNFTMETLYVIDETGKHIEHSVEVSYTYSEDGYPLTIDKKWYDSEGNIDKEMSECMSITYQ